MSGMIDYVRVLLQEDSDRIPEEATEHYDERRGHKMTSEMLILIVCVVKYTSHLQKVGIWSLKLIFDHIYI